MLLFVDCCLRGWLIVACEFCWLFLLLVYLFLVCLFACVDVALVCCFVVVFRLFYVGVV